ncbi:titin-like [Strongylocentrotus purpuratus]|uniref:Ig-like domain-containing protein n=1 Tax=Strongylocentrotus purpuratus TaxID=7668 RepID=A0A7M7NDQ6_STRPU|nr:titin-like [Strongylocentrotus purpuratus]
MGDDFTMRCAYSPPSDYSVIRWRHGNTILKFAQYTTAIPFRTSFPNPAKYKFMGDDHSTSLTINNLNTDDNGDYSCIVFNADGHDSSNMTLQVLNPAPPSDLFISDDRSPIGYPDNPYISMTAGEPRDITCTVRGARPPALIEWRTDAEHIQVMDQVDVVQGQSYMYISRGVATITPSKDYHNRIIRCLASHRELQNVLQATILLNIQGIFKK